MIAVVYGGRNLATAAEVDVKIVAPGIGRMTCLECRGDPEAYAAAFGNRRHDLAPDGCVDCKNRGWLYVNV